MLLFEDRDNYENENISSHCTENILWREDGFCLLGGIKLESMFIQKEKHHLESKKENKYFHIQQIIKKDKIQKINCTNSMETINISSYSSNNFEIMSMKFHKGLSLNEKFELFSELLTKRENNEAIFGVYARGKKVNNAEGEKEYKREDIWENEKIGLGALFGDEEYEDEIEEEEEIVDDYLKKIILIFYNYLICISLCTNIFNI